MKVTAPDQAGIEVKIKILPKEKFKAWKNRNKTEQIGIGADGTLSFPNDEITDFYVEGVKVSDAKEEITMTMEVKEGQRNQVVDTIKFAVGPILEDLKVETGAVGYRFKQENGNIEFMALNQTPTSMEPGALIEALVHLPENGASPDVKFIQNIGPSNTRDVYYSNLRKENPLLRAAISHDGVTFPVLDANPPIASQADIFYSVGYTSASHPTFSIHDSPITRLPAAPGDGTKFEKLEWVDDFITYVVAHFDDGTIFPLGKTTWDIDALFETDWVDADGDNVEDPGERSIRAVRNAVNWSGSFDKPVDTVGTVHPPTAKEILQVSTVPIP